MDNCTSKRQDCSLHSPLHTRQLQCLLRMLSTTHSTTHSRCMSTYVLHIQHYPLHCLPQSSKNTRHIVGKMAHNVGMGVKELWRHLHLVWLVLRVPSHCDCFFFTCFYCFVVVVVVIDVIVTFRHIIN